jgi:hypothetical protein
MELTVVRKRVMWDDEWTSTRLNRVDRNKPGSSTYPICFLYMHRNRYTSLKVVESKHELFKVDDDDSFEYAWGCN